MRFAFGRNWQQYARRLDEPKIERATGALVSLVGPLDGKSFLDAGCGSGIHSLAAVRAGAREVRSFDYDEDAVATAKHIRDERAPDAPWHIERGDILDPPDGTWDVVYSWGVLHHTGDLWSACDNAARLVADGGTLVVSLYNDQGWVSRVWRAIKRTYVQVPPLRPLMLLISFVWTWGPAIARDLQHRRNPMRRWRDYGNRGMAAWHDLVDWTGGWPFETASVDRTVAFFEQQGFTAVEVRSVGRSRGCNEYAFKRSEAASR